MGDSVMCAKAVQLTPQGFYNIERMLKPVLGNKGHVAASGTCMERRGITPDLLVGGVTRGTLEELTDWALWADRILDF